MNVSSSSAEVIAQTLHEAGVRYAFGYPGGEVVDLIDAFERCGIDFVLTGHESAAAFMAGTVGRLTGFPGVCLSTLGPGACNLVLGVGCAYLERDPLLAFSAQTATQWAGRSSKQYLPLNELFTPISKWSLALEGVGTGETIRWALSLAQTPPRGPVYLTLPSDVARQPDSSGEPVRPPAALPPDASALAAIAQALNVAERPIAVIGFALDPVRDLQAVRRFLAETGLPYAVTPQGKGIVDEDREAYLGAVAPAAGDAAIIEAIRQSDCLLGVGFNPVESSQGWHFDVPHYSIVDASVGFQKYRPLAEATGNVSLMLDELRAAYVVQSTWTLDEVRQIRRRIAADIEPAESSGPSGLSPFHAVRALQEALPDDTIVTADVGAHKVLISQAWKVLRPGLLLLSNGLSAMGYGLPAAVAASLLNPGQPVVSLLGDGGFGMMVQELETARRLGVSPLIVVFCDRSLAIIKMAQQRRHIPYRGVDFAPVDWARVAEGFGARGTSVSTLEGLQQAVNGWRAQPELTVVAAAIDESLYRGFSY